MFDRVASFRRRGVNLGDVAITIEAGEVAGARRTSDFRLAMPAQMVLVADVHGRVGLVAELRELLDDLADASRAEPECVQFRVLAGEDPGELVLLSVWRDEAGLRAHYDSPHYRRYRAQVGPFLARPSDVDVYQASSVIHARDPNPPDPGYFG
jgi:quinol monooxygenase YgiN